MLKFHIFKYLKGGFVTQFFNMQYKVNMSCDLTL